MTDQADGGSQEVARAISRVLATVTGQVQQLELRRRIAEARLSQVTGSDLPLDRFDDFWRELEALGLASDERQASMSFYRATFLIEHAGPREDILSALRAIGAVAERLPAARDESLAVHFEQVLSRLRDKDAKASAPS